MTKQKHIPSTVLVITITALSLSGCSLSNDQKAPTEQVKATYQIIATTANQDMSMKDMKPIIDYRAKVKKLRSINSEVVDNTLVLTGDTSELTPVIAEKMTEINQLSIGEKRKNFTGEEITRKKTYNEGQKDSMNRAYEEAKESPDSFDDVVTTYSENTNLIDKSVHDFQTGKGLQREIADTLFATGTGSITKLVTTSNMLWFAKVLDRKEHEEITAQHILISYIGSKAQNPYLHRTKSQAEKFMNEIKDTITPKNFSAKARELSDDASNSGKGGILGRVESSSRTRRNRIRLAFYFGHEERICSFCKIPRYRPFFEATHS